MNGLSDVRLKLYGGELGQARHKVSPGASREMSTLRLWAHRWRTRQTLLELTPSQLRDIGMSRADAIEEGLKPFWRS